MTATCVTIGRMEIEAKFAIADPALFERLTQVEQLAGFSLSPVQPKRVHDQYLDTADGAILAGGYACRVRVESGGGRLLTLKSLAPAQGALYMREELEVRLPPASGLDVAGWPDSPATALARQLSADRPLVLLFELQQERYRRLAATAGSSAPAVELSIDIARISTEPPIELLGVEAELLPAGNLADLQALIDELHHGWGLAPDLLSKFDRGLAAAQPHLASLLPIP